MRVCSVAGCPTIYEGLSTRCPEHEREADKKHWKQTSVYKSPGHRAFRAAVLRRDPVCVICHIRVATIADHYPMERTELIELGLDPNDPQHGRGLDKKCHDEHTAHSHPAGWAAPQD